MDILAGLRRYDILRHAERGFERLIRQARQHLEPFGFVGWQHELRRNGPELPVDATLIRLAHHLSPAVAPATAHRCRVVVKAVG